MKLVSFLLIVCYDIFETTISLVISIYPQILYYSDHLLTLELLGCSKQPIRIVFSWNYDTFTTIFGKC